MLIRIWHKLFKSLLANFNIIHYVDDIEQEYKILRASKKV